MSTITVSGNSSESRALVDQLAFIAGGAAEKRKNNVVKKDNGVAITGSYWGQEESWKEAERENMTAVCMERWNREKDGKTESGVTFRIAMNSGVPLDVLEWLKGIISVMEQCSRGGEIFLLCMREAKTNFHVARSELDSEDLLWAMVVEMNSRKIYDDIVKRFYEPVSRTGEAGNSLPTLTSRIMPILKQYSASTGSKLLGEAVSVRDGATCLTKLHKLCERIVEQGRKVDQKLLKELLIQCFHLRRSRTFRAFLFSFQDGYELFRTIQKLGRYRIATQALIDAIRTNPGQFNNVEVEPVQPPSSFDVNASIYPDADLKQYLRGLMNTWRITSISKESFEQMKGHFTDRCAELPVVHAEMQLIKYYEENPKEHQPTLIGCSKKPCQVCVRFIHLHGKFQVEKAHARISHRWAIPNIRCNSAETTEKIADILNTISREMEDSLKEIINLGPKEQPKQLREAGKSSTLLSPHDVVPISKNAGTRIPMDIQHASSFDSGFVDSPNSSLASFDGATVKDWYGGLNGIVSRDNSITETPPPLHRLYHPPPPIPNSPPPLRRRRGSPGSLSEEYRIAETFGVRLRPVSMRTTAHTSATLVEGQHSPPPSSPTPPIPAIPSNKLRERGSSPTLGWNTRFPRHSIDSPETIGTSLAVPPTPPPEPEREVEREVEGEVGEPEVEVGPSTSIPNLQVYHGSQSSGLDEIPEDPQPQNFNRPSTPLDPALIFFQNRTSRPRSVTGTNRSSAISPHGRLSRVVSHRRLIPEPQSGSDISPPLTPNLQQNVDIDNSNPMHPQSCSDPGSSNRSSFERKTVDVEIIDSTSPHRNVVYDIDDIGRLPTPPHNIFSHYHDRPHSPGRAKARRSSLISSESRQRLRHTPPANIPHIVITSTSHPQSQHHLLREPRPPPQPPEAYYSPDSSYLSPTPPSSSSSSSNSLTSSAYTPSLSRRHNRLRLPPTGSPSPPLTPPQPPVLAPDPEPPESDLSATTATFSSCSYFTNSTNSSYFSGSSGSYLSSSSGGSAATATSHISIQMDEPLSSLDREVGTLRDAYRSSSTLRQGYRTSSSRFRRSRDLDDDDYGGRDTYYSQDSQYSSSLLSSHFSSAASHPPLIPEPPGMKSFLLRAVNKQQQQLHPAGGGESISWINLDIGEDLLRGSERFEVSAQLLDPDKRNRRRDRDRDKARERGRERGSVDHGGGEGNGLVLHHEYDRNADRLVLDIDFGGAVLRLKIYW